MRGENFATAVGKTCPCTNEANGNAFLDLPTTCESPPTTTVSGRSWPHGALNNEARRSPARKQPNTPSRPALHGLRTAAPSARRSGSNRAASSREHADRPDGEGQRAPGRHARRRRPGRGRRRATTVTLPRGVRLNPARGQRPADLLDRTDRLRTGLPESSQAAEQLRSRPAPSQLPRRLEDRHRRHQDAADWTNELSGGVYLAAQEAEPVRLACWPSTSCAEEPDLGRAVKLAGEGRLDRQAPASSLDLPEHPAGALRRPDVNLFGGQRARRSRTPPLCGSYTTTASSVPWSGTGRSPRASASFSITSGRPAAARLPAQPAAVQRPRFQARLEQSAGRRLHLLLADDRPPGLRSAADGDRKCTCPAASAAMLSSVTPCPRTAGRPGRQLRPGQPDRARDRVRGPRLRTVLAARQRLPDRPLRRRALRPARSSTPADRRPVQPRRCDRALEDQRRSAHGRGDDDHRSRPPFCRRSSEACRSQLKQIHGHRRSPELPVQPDQLQAEVDQRHAHAARRARSAGVSSPFQVGGCQGLPFTPEADGLHQRQRQQTNGAEPEGQGRAPRPGRRTSPKPSWCCRSRCPRA